MPENKKSKEKMIHLNYCKIRLYSEKKGKYIYLNALENVDLFSPHTHTQIETAKRDRQ